MNADFYCVSERARFTRISTRFLYYSCEGDKHMQGVCTFAWCFRVIKSHSRYFLFQRGSPFFQDAGELNQQEALRC